MRVRSACGALAISVLVTTTLARGAVAQPLPDETPPPSTAQESLFEFALIGDNPYPTEDVPKFERLIDDLNQHTQLEWVIHLGDTVGDIRGVPTLNPCSDESLTAASDRLHSISAPVFVTPGDNDWLDCRVSNETGGGFDPLERLAFLRTLLFPDSGRSTGARLLDVESQSTIPGFEQFVENQMRVHDGIVFSTIHLVALPDDVSTEVAQFYGRLMEAALAWIEVAFRRADELDSPGVFLATQADLWTASGPATQVRQSTPRPGLEQLYPALAEATLA